MAMELRELKPPDNKNEQDELRLGVLSGNESCSNNNTPNATEDSCLLSEIQVAESNGPYTACVEVDQPGPCLEPVGTLGRLKKELKEPACWKLKVWMLILICFILIILAIFLSIYFCSVYQEDVDEKYNVSEFVVPRFFTGNFTLLKTLDAQSQSTDSLLKEKLTQIYTDSHALGRYFSFATVNPLSSRNSSFEYELKFMMPNEHKQIKLYVLNQEMVYSVLLQHLIDQDTGDPLYIEPSSLTMEVK